MSMLQRLVRSVSCMGLIVFIPALSWAQEPATPIDWQRARELHRRATSGEKLTPEEQAYYERAKRERSKGSKSEPGAVPPAKSSLGIVPLTELSSGQYQGFDGGLYGGGRNEPPAEHRARAEAALAHIRPLNARGEPAADGRIVLISLGMSNTTQEFSRFVQLSDGDRTRHPRVIAVDGAQGGQTGDIWAGDRDRGTRPWDVLAQRLQSAGVTPEQVQVCWMKHANAGPAGDGPFPAHAQKLRDNVIAIAGKLHERFPNLRVVYLSSRIYGGYATTALNPEPYAFEEAFSMRWAIEEQIQGNPKLNCDSAKGPVTAPVLLWGPYLWGDGTTARRVDGLVWTRDDLSGDGTHPNDSGRQKVAQLLLKFFQTDPLANTWYLAK